MSGPRWTRRPSEVVAEGLKLEAELAPGPHVPEHMDRGTRPSRILTTKVAELLGVGRYTYDQAKVVIRAAKHEPSRYGDLVELMDHSCQVTPAYDLYRWRRDGIAPPIDASAVERLAVRIDDLTDHLVSFDPAAFGADLAEQTAKQVADTVSKLRTFRNRLNKERT